MMTVGTIAYNLDDEAKLKATRMEVKRKLSEQFEMTNSGEVRQFLGMTIERDFGSRRHENWPARLSGRIAQTLRHERRGR